jgi:chromosome segregation ATPase
MSTLATCANLILSGEQSFGLIRDLLETQVDQIERLGGAERAEIFRRHMDQLREYSEVLYSHLHADVIGLSQQVFAKMQADQASRRDEIKRQVEEETKRVADMKSSDEAYQKDIEMAGHRVQAAEFGIRSAEETLAKIQALLKTNKEALAKEQKTIAYLNARRDELQQELMTRSSALENLELQFATEVSLSEDALRMEALTKVEQVREEEIEKTKNFIRELARLR